MDENLLFGILFVLSGIAIILIPLLIDYIKSKRCTLEVRAESRRHGIYGISRTWITTIYTYIYNNVTYECEIRGPGEPSPITIYINPNKPKEFFYRNYNQRKLDNKLKFLMSGMFIIWGILLILVGLGVID